MLEIKISGAVSFMDRLFFSTLNIDKTMKVGAAVVSCRRGGNTATFDMLNKYFTMCGMPVASSQYWNMVHGGTPEEVLKDEEGMQTMRTLGRNMAFLMKSIRMGKGKIGPSPERTDDLYQLPPLERGEQSMKTWLITGCSTGLGRSLAKAALQKGDNVVVTARDTKKLEEFEKDFPQTALTVRLDVTDLCSVAEAV